MNKSGVSVIGVLATILFAPVHAADHEAKLMPASPFAGFKECAALRMKEINLKHLETDESKYFTQIPTGWTVVGGTGGEGHPKLLICR